MKKYYRVEILAGHRARSSDDDVLIFFFIAHNALEASDMARKMPAAKHSRIDAIKSIHQITKKEYVEGRHISAYKRREDPLSCEVDKND